jgi:hypothetical protein
MFAVRKTSVYLTDEEVRRLAQLAKEEGSSQAEVIRRAIGAYQPSSTPDRSFAMSGAGLGPGGSVADIPEEELLEGFGED